MMMRALAANIFQLGMLGVGVSLLFAWINYLKAARGGTSSEEQEDRSAEGQAAATRSRTGP